MRYLATAALAAVVLTAPAQAQYRWEENQALGIRFQVYKKLKAIPMRLGSGDPHLRARFEPDNDGDYIYGRYGKYAWQLYVYEFDPKGTPITGDDAQKKPKDEEEAKRLEEAKRARARLVAKDFEEWVKFKDRGRSKRKFFAEAKMKKGTSKKPGYAWWEYSDGQAGRDSSGKQVELRWYKTAAAYEIDGKEVVLLVVLPVKKGDRPDSKYRSWAKRMVTSLRLLKEDAGDVAAEDAKREQFAKTEKQKKELARLKKNIADLDNWDYFTTPNYIITYSWDKPRKRLKAKAFAQRISDRLEEIRTKFVEYFPPHEKQVKNYSVIRVCADYADFMKYGNTPGGVVGWFSPSSKELCVFYDTDKRFGDENYIIGVCYHEAWHQYSDGYWPDTELHRWYDEGLAEFFNSWRLRGRRWKIEYLRGRYDSIKTQINVGPDEPGKRGYVPGREIVTWSKPKFYAPPRGPDRYAQAYAMVDLLMRGREKLGRRWDPIWDQILPTYNKIAMETKDGKAAVAAAFKGVDFEKFDEAWKDWVERGYIKKM